MTALAMRQTGLKPAAKIVLYWIADHHNETTGDCFPSISRLANLCQMSRRSVEGCLSDLEAFGLIKVVPRFRDTGGKTSNGYILLFVDSDAQNLRIPPAKSAHGDAQNLRMNNLGKDNLGNEQYSFVDRFEEFWTKYPHRNGAKKGKAAAKKAWGRAVKCKVSEDEIVAGALRYTRDRQVLDGYAKDPATWINSEGWADDIEPSKASPQSVKSGKWAKL